MPLRDNILLLSVSLAACGSGDVSTPPDTSIPGVPAQSTHSVAITTVPGWTWTTTRVQVLTGAPGYFQLTAFDSTTRESVNLYIPQVTTPGSYPQVRGSGWSLQLSHADSTWSSETTANGTVQFLYYDSTRVVGRFSAQVLWTLPHCCASSGKPYLYPISGTFDLTRADW
jgi:hypothetical protein